MAAWYLPKADELLIDIDRALEPMHKSGASRLELFFRRRLRDAERAQKFLLQYVVLEPSYTEGNIHAFVKLRQPLPDLERLIWQSWLGSDLYRSRTDLMRLSMRHPFPSLLIAPKRARLWRDPDAVCECPEKHDTVELYEHPERACDTWRKYRGPTPWECFGSPATDADEGATPALPMSEPIRLHLIREI